MALLFGRQRRTANLIGYYGSWAGATAADLIPPRGVSPAFGLPAVTNDTAMRHSAVWACLRLRANLIASMPVDIYRKVGGIQMEMPKPPIFVNPGGDRVDWVEWMYSTQIDLDRAGNAIGLITERNGAGLPQRIDLMPIQLCSLRFQTGTSGDTGLEPGRDAHATLIYHIDGKDYAPDQVWHEKQYTVAGFPVGLSPIAYAAWTIAEAKSIQDFALTWFGGGGIPRGHLRNKQQTMSSAAADAVKARFKSTVASGDVFVTGADWEYSMIQAEQTGTEWLEAQKFGVTEIARFFDVPADLLDAPAQARGAITYANVTQRNMQFFIMHLGPAVVRRETALSRLLPQPRYAKLNTGALLRMDDLNRSQVIQTRIDSRTLTPNEAREMEDLPPLTSAQLTQFHDMFGDPNNPATPH